MPSTNSSTNPEVESIRQAYQEHGTAQQFYQNAGGHYRNPHETAVRECFRQCHADWGLDLSNVLDLACGSGEITLEVKGLGGRVVGMDPFTGCAYSSRTGQQAESVSFQDVGTNGLGSRKFSLIVCSYAMHLVEPSWLPMLVYRLSEASNNLLILSPHKRPDLSQLCSKVEEKCHNRVRATLYSLNEGFVS